ncbi:MAG: Membrane-associated zinc metalloprotease [Candidatus Levybacteria bacterium GW2011_GWB1_35_5]|nr:MAG: Membrane-associated zinc metalloprotease [Candidatus Levybacteria bacterium GW2011_GWB1_35_5]
MLVTILVFLLILSILVLIHEAGHFFVAKFFKIKVEEFGFGLPPRAFGIKRGETIYSINWLPIGGFVKLYGEDEAGAGKVSLPKKAKQTKAKDADRAFYSRPVWQRATVVFAGVFMNFVLAVAIVSFLFSVIGVAVPGKDVIVDQVVKGAPAQESGLKPGDKIIAINNVNITTPDQLVSYTKGHLGEKLVLKVKDSKLNTRTVEVTPRKVYPKDQGPMGVAISQSVTTKKYPIWEAPFVGTKEVLNQSVMIGKGLFTVVFQLVTKGSVPKDVAGPVGIAQLTGTVVEIGLPAVLSFVALLSLNLAIINILPIPALDGGRLFFILIEGFTGKKVSPRIENYAHTIGMAVLLGLIALITIHDLLRIISGQPLIPQIK